MDPREFLNVILRRKWLILSISVLAIIITYLITRETTRSYTSTTLMATGIVNDTRPIAEVEETQNYRRYTDAEDRFINLIEIMYSRTVVSLLSYKLILHDLTSDKPFKNLDEIKKQYSRKQLEEAKEEFRTKLQTAQTILPEQRNEGTLRDILKQAGYNYEELVKKLKIKRKSRTDYLELSYTAELPHLAAYAVNTYSEEFINYYRSVSNERSARSVEFFTELAVRKKEDLDKKVDSLKNYKLNNDVVNIEEQISQKVDQMRELEVAREDEKKKIPAARQSLRNINSLLNEREKQFTEVQARNAYIKSIKDQLQDVNDEYITSGMKNEKAAQKRKELRKKLDDAIENSTNTSTGLTDSRQDLINKKLETEVELDIATGSVESINSELKRLDTVLQNFVDKEAIVSALEREINVATDEYLDVVNKLNSAKFNAIAAGDMLKVMEVGRVPESPDPSKTLFLSAFAGIVTLSFSVVLLLALTYLDTRLKSPNKYKQLVKLPLLGYINTINFNRLNMATLFHNKSQDPDLETFKQQLRKIRFNIDASGVKKFLITSPKMNEGKSFIIVSLAYALSLNNKRILIIDTNFRNNSLSKMLKKVKPTRLLANTELIGELNLEDEFVNYGIISRTTNSGIDLIGSRHLNNSPSEIFGGKNFYRLITELSKSYDFIFLEGASLNDYSDTKELEKYVDKVIGIFSAESSVGHEDKNSISYLTGLDGKYLGSILNKVDQENVV